MVWLFRFPIDAYRLFQDVFSERDNWFGQSGFFDKTIGHRGFFDKLVGQKAHTDFFEGQPIFGVLAFLAFLSEKIVNVSI